MAIRLFFLLLCLSGIDDRESLRFSFVAEQGFDRSCGLSVLASFLGMYWGLPSDELGLAGEFFAGRLAKGDLTISLADMAMVLRTRGFACSAYQMTFEQLEKAVGACPPLIVHLGRTGGHFALVLAASGEELLVADPAEGTGWTGRGQFEAEWSGKALAAVLQGRRVDSDRIARALRLARGREELLDRAALSRIGAATW